MFCGGSWAIEGFPVVHGFCLFWEVPPFDLEMGFMFVIAFGSCWQAVRALLDPFGWGCWKNQDYLGYEVSFWLTGLLSRVSEVVFAGCLPIYVLFLNNRRQ